MRAVGDWHGAAESNRAKQISCEVCVDMSPQPSLKARAYPASGDDDRKHPCPDGGIGRRTVFRWRRSQGRGGSSPLLGTIHPDLRLNFNPLGDGLKFGPPSSPPSNPRSNVTRCAPMRSPLATPHDPDSVGPPGYCRNRGIAMLSSWEHRDEDSIKASAQGVGSVLTSAHRTIGKGRAIPQAGRAGLDLRVLGRELPVGRWRLTDLAVQRNPVAGGQ